MRLEDFLVALLVFSVAGVSLVVLGMIAYLRGRYYETPFRVALVAASFMTQRKRRFYLVTSSPR